MSVAELYEESEVGEAEAEAPIYDFDEEFQDKIAALALRDTAFLQRAGGLIRPEFFANEAIAGVVGICLDFYSRFRKVPDKASLGPLLRDAFDKKRIRKDLVEEVRDAIKRLYAADVSDRGFVEEKVGEFARHRAVEEAILAGVRDLEKGDFAKIEKRVKEAMLVGVSDLTAEYDYFSMIEARTQRRKDLAAGIVKPNGISSGYVELDKLLYHHGWGRKELSVIMGAAKAGKSMSLGEFGKHASLLGYNVIYFTLEVAAAIIADRLDSNISEIAMKELKAKPIEIQKKIEAAKAKAGVFKILEYPTGTLKPSGVRRVLEEYRARGVTFDLVIVDYADIMAPERHFEKDTENSKSIYVDLRGIAFDYDCALLTATQTNREGAKKSTAGMTDVAEDFNKIRIADIVISINATEEERATGEARLFFAAVRNGESGITLNIQQDRERMRFITKVLGRTS